MGAGVVYAFVEADAGDIAIYIRLELHAELDSFGIIYGRIGGRGCIIPDAAWAVGLRPCHCREGPGVVAGRRIAGQIFHPRIDRPTLDRRCVLRSVGQGSTRRQTGRLAGTIIAHRRRHETASSVAQLKRACSDASWIHRLAEAGCHHRIRRHIHCPGHGVHRGDRRWCRVSCVIHRHSHH